jgi:hypothetical protein
MEAAKRRIKFYKNSIEALISIIYMSIVIKNIRKTEYKIIRSTLTSSRISIS